MKPTAIKLFTTIAIAEGVSYLLLLLIAMPLKYFFDLPLMVKYAGWAHGVLFMAYSVSLLTCWIQHRWPFSQVAFFFFASLMPFLPFWVERKLSRESATI